MRFIQITFVISSVFLLIACQPNAPETEISQADEKQAIVQMFPDAACEAEGVGVFYRHTEDSDQIVMEVIEYPSKILFQTDTDFGWWCEVMLITDEGVLVHQSVEGATPRGSKYVAGFPDRDVYKISVDPWLGFEDSKWPAVQYRSQPRGTILYTTEDRYNTFVMLEPGMPVVYRITPDQGFVREDIARHPDYVRAILKTNLARVEKEVAAGLNAEDLPVSDQIPALQALLKEIEQQP